MTFDLKAARDALSRATKRANVATDIYHLAALTYLPAALDEIERQADRIAELEATVSALRSENCIGCVAKLEYIDKQRAALKKLGEAKRARGKALVEERIAGKFSNWIENQCPHLGIDDGPFCIKLDGPCEYREGKCPIQTELLTRAHEQLRREGKL